MELSIDAWKMDRGASNPEDLGTVIESRLCVTPESSCETGPRPSKWGGRRLSNESGAMKGRCSTGTGPFPLNSPWSSGDSLWRPLHSILMV